MSMRADFGEAEVKSNLVHWNKSWRNKTNTRDTHVYADETEKFCRRQILSFRTVPREVKMWHRIHQISDGIIIEILIEKR